MGVQRRGRSLEHGDRHSIVSADGGETEIVDAVLRPFARAIAGTSLTQTWTPATKTFTASFTPTTGISDLSLPPRAYPSGFTVAVTGACFDTTTAGHLLLQPDPSSKQVTLTVTSR
jgi:Glycoside hydrolase family 5 C-terminal domain